MILIEGGKKAGDETSWQGGERLGEGGLSSRGGLKADGRRGGAGAAWRKKLLLFFSRRS